MRVVVPSTLTNDNSFEQLFPVTGNDFRLCMFGGDGNSGTTKHRAEIRPKTHPTSSFIRDEGLWTVTVCNVYTCQCFST